MKLQRERTKKKKMAQDKALSTAYILGGRKRTN